MRGQTNVIATVLLVTISVALVAGYYIFSTSLLNRTTSDVTAFIEENKRLAETYLSISSATGRALGSIDDFSITIANSGQVDVHVVGPVTVYLYKGGVVYYSTKTSSCGDVIKSGDVCHISFSFAGGLKTRADFSDLSVTVYVNEIPLSAPVTYVGSIPGYALYEECNSCSSCSSLISSAPPNTVVLVTIPNTVSGDCLSINDANDVTVYCGSKIVGSGSGTGVSITNSSNVSLRSCEIMGFSNGISISNSAGISFSSVYAHDNTVDLYVDPATACNQNLFSSVDLITTLGPFYVYRDESSTSHTVVSAGGAWFYNTSSVTFSGVSSTSPARLGSVSPTVAVCGSTGTYLSDLNISAPPYAIYLNGDASTTISGAFVSAGVRGIWSVSSVGSTICCSTFSSPLALFDLPQDVEWDENTVFR